MPPLVQFGSSVNIDVVSIHPRLFRRGNNKIGNSGLDKLCFNPPPPFQARERTITNLKQYETEFQSTPAFSGEGTALGIDVSDSFAVSIHPRLFRRGNIKTKKTRWKTTGFNPPPPFQAREQPCGKPMIIGKLSEW